ncbi:MAG TPA: hypothetical protein ENI37_03365 [Chloroflexi bacterium]|nr:hypothetical protein [Chloroflexota bacterium]
MEVQTEVARGRPLKVGDRTLVPVVRRTTGVWRQATIGTHHLASRGGGFVCLQPVGLIEQQGEGERFIPIPDKTRQALWGFLATALVVPLLLTLAARLTRR